MVTGMTRIFNAFVEALNNRLKLPKYVFFVPDYNILKHIHAAQNNGLDITTCIEWLLKNIENFTSRREFQLFERRPGALLPGGPKFVWVKMFKRPEDLVGQNIPPEFKLRNKFNNALESILAQGSSHFEHLILSIDIGEEFTNFGSLTSSGKDRFWIELNTCLKKYELHQINLKPKIKNKEKRRKGSHKHGKHPDAGQHDYHDRGDHDDSDHEDRRPRSGHDNSTRSRHRSRSSSRNRRNSRYTYR